MLELLTTLDEETTTELELKTMLELLDVVLELLATLDEETTTELELGTILELLSVVPELFGGGTLELLLGIAVLPGGTVPTGQVATMVPEIQLSSVGI
jgi:hypothetical protein